LKQVGEAFMKFKKILKEGGEIIKQAAHLKLSNIFDEAKQHLAECLLFS